MKHLAIVVAAVFALTVPGSFVASSQAVAQEAQGQQQGGGLLRFLFGRNDQPRVREAPREAAPQRRAQPRRAATGSSAPRAPAVVAVEKSDDAKLVLVIGDFLAGGLAEGLATAYAEDPEIRVIDRSNGSSGLVRDDHFDWPGRIGDMLDADEPAVVVVMIGSNDRQQLRVDGTRESVRSEAWLKEYEARATALARAVRDRDLPLVWVGTLPFRPGAMSSDMIAFNDVFRRVSEGLRGEYVDVWDGFVDENGAFVTSGPDMNGIPAQLRASDGINVTRPGRRKIAFYAEKPLARLLGGGGAPAGIARIGPDEPLTELDPERLAIIDRTMPVSLTDPDLDGGLELLGGAPRAGVARDTQTAAERLVRDGIAPDTRPGRADDFGMARGGTPPPAEAAARTPTAEDAEMMTP